MPPSETQTELHSRRFELLVFLLLVLVIVPAISMALISAYGFVVWFSQLIFGPPGA